MSAVIFSRSDIIAWHSAIIPDAGFIWWAAA
jgi:hypothetical protein